MKEELAWFCTKELWVVQWNSEEKQTRIQKAPETVVCTAFETNDIFSGPHDVKTPQTLSIYVQVESIRDHVIDLRRLWIWVQPDLFIGC